MYILSPKNRKVLEDICRLTPGSLQQFLFSFLKRNYDNVERKQKYLYAEGKIPVLLVAHIDTVFPKPPISIYYDSIQDVMWSPEGLGADDRAGVFGILKIIQRGYRPYILFADEEEKGGIGTSTFIQEHPEGPELKYVIELDRQGEKDCVFYDCDNSAFVDYVETFGFKENFGSFTDISIICPEWKVAGVNLSVGYQNEHSYIETLKPRQLMKTINNVCHMLDEIDSSESYKYIPTKYQFNYKFFQNISTDSIKEKCDKCNSLIPVEDLIPIQYKDGSWGQICLDCIDKDNEQYYSWCADCGNLYEVPTDDQNNYYKLFLCPSCYEKALKRGKVE